MSATKKFWMMGGLAVLVASASPLPAQDEPAPTERQQIRRAPVLRERTGGRDLLQKYVDKVDWVDATFAEVVEWLRDQADGNVNILIQKNQLLQEGVDEEKPVTLSLRDTTVGEVLLEVVQQLNEDGQVRFRAVGDSLRISTRADFERHMVTRVYNVADLVLVPPDFGRSAPTIDLEQAARQGGSQGGGGGGGQSVFGGGSSGGTEDLEEEEDEVEMRMQDLRDVIRNSVAPETWAGDVGGGGGAGVGFQASGTGRGRIVIFNNRSLVVTNTIEVHEEIAGFFSQDR